MHSVENVSDSSDWLNTPVASLSTVEAGLRCHICKDFFNAPVITACSHTFCSACIRRSLSAVNAQKKCPLCWSSFDEIHLRKNTIVEDLVRGFQAARPEILALGQQASQIEHNAGVANDRKRKIEQAQEQIEDPSPRKTRSRSRRLPIVQSSVSPEPEESLEDGDLQNGRLQLDDGLASCPICQRRMPEAQVFTHLDEHQEGAQANTTGRRTTIELPTIPSRSQTSTPPLKPLPTITYHLLSETQLRKKLGELGISTAGPKQTMIRRHSEWRNLVNANCDSSNPKSKRELLQDLKEWEKAQSSGNSNAPLKLSKSSAVMEKDFDRGAWSSNHSNDFRSLIAQARAKSKKPADSGHPGPETEINVGQTTNKPGDASVSMTPQQTIDTPQPSSSDMVVLDG